MLPLPAALLPNPLLTSCEATETFKVAGPALVSTDTGEMLKLTSCGGVLSAAAEPANKANAATAHRNRGKQRSIRKRSMDGPRVVVGTYEQKSQGDLVNFRGWFPGFLERETGFEPATSTLARSHSTN